MVFGGGRLYKLKNIEQAMFVLLENLNDETCESVEISTKVWIGDLWFLTKHFSQWCDAEWWFSFPQSILHMLFPSWWSSWWRSTWKVDERIRKDNPCVMKVFNKIVTFNIEIFKNKNQYLYLIFLVMLTGWVESTNIIFCQF